MAKPKLELSGRNVPEKIAFGKQVVIAMTGNANFPNLATQTADFADATTNLENTNNEVAGALATYQQKQILRDTAEAEFNTAANVIATGVDSASGGDAVKIQSSGLDLKNASTPPGPMPPVQGLSVTAGEADGTARLKWNKVSGTKSYEVQRSLDATSGWAHLCSCTRSGATVNGMTSGTRYWFRVAAVGAADTGPWSDPATKIAP